MFSSIKHVYKSYCLSLVRPLNNCFENIAGNLCLCRQLSPVGNTRVLFLFSWDKQYQRLSPRGGQIKNCQNKIVKLFILWKSVLVRVKLPQIYSNLIFACRYSLIQCRSFIIVYWDTWVQLSKYLVSPCSQTLKWLRMFINFLAINLKLLVKYFELPALLQRWGNDSS